MANHKKNAARRNQRAAARSLSPLWLAGGGALLLALAGLAVWLGFGARATPAEIQVKGAPRLSVDREKVDLGDVRLGQTVEVTFEIANVGDQPLRFTQQPYIEVVEGC